MSLLCVTGKNLAVNAVSLAQPAFFSTTENVVGLLFAKIFFGNDCLQSYKEIVSAMDTDKRETVLPHLQV
jgi:hypothetical protein